MIDFIKEKFKEYWDFILVGFIWFCIWATYNTDIFRVFAPGFPNNAIDLIHGFRAFFPLIAIIISIFILAKKKNLPESFFMTPMGLLAIYTIVGIISSVFSNNPLAALYWAILYGSPIIVLSAILVTSNPLKKLSLILNINWAIAGIITTGLIIFFLIQPGVISSLTPNLLICGNRPYEGLAGVSFEINTLGMAGTRPTGLGRYAGVATIVCFFIFYFRKNKSKFIWLILFLLFLLTLIFARGRTEIIGFLFAVPFVFLLWRKYKYFLFFLIGLLIFSFGFNFFYKSVCFVPIIDIPTIAQGVKPIVQPVVQPIVQPVVQPIVQPVVQPVEPVIKEVSPVTFFLKSADIRTLSGRTSGVWLDSVHLFLSNPLTGYGFQADRFFLNGQHAHNSILHALVQTGILGTIPFVLAIILTLLILLRLFKSSQVTLAERNFLVMLSTVLVFFAVRSITESVAFFSADWLFVAPIIAYIQCLDGKIRKEKINLKMDFCDNKIDLIGKADVVEKIKYWIKNESQKLHWVIVTGMHGVVEAEKHADFKYILSNADLWVPDGISLVWLAKLKGFKIKERVSGADLMQKFFKVTEENGFSSYFYGDTEETLQALDKKLLLDFPNLKIVGSYSPPFRKLTEKEDEEIIQKINQARPDVLWVALGLPKQEKWIFEHREKLNVPIVIGVGAAFKFLSGKVKRAPIWIGNLGFEWLWRLIKEPKVTWKRVIIDIPIFIWLIIKDFFIGNKLEN